jgi:hypothetical protein
VPFSSLSISEYNQNAGYYFFRVGGDKFRYAVDKSGQLEEKFFKQYFTKRRSAYDQ